MGAYHDGGELGLGDLGSVETLDGHDLARVDVERLVHGAKAASADKLAHALQSPRASGHASGIFTPKAEKMKATVAGRCVFNKTK